MERHMEVQSCGVSGGLYRKLSRSAYDQPCVLVMFLIAVTFITYEGNFREEGFMLAQGLRGYNHGREQETLKVLTSQKTRKQSARSEAVVIYYVP